VKVHAEVQRPTHACGLGRCLLAPTSARSGVRSTFILNQVGPGERGKCHCPLRCEDDDTQIMAFAGVISDLFNCGRPRRPQTRNGSISGEDATRMVAVTQNAGLDMPTTAAAAPSDARLHAVPEDEELPRPTSVESKAPFNSRPSTRRASIEANPADNIQDAPAEEPRSRTKRSESSDTNTKAKASIGKQVEQRFLVTIDTPASSNAPTKLSLDHVEASVVEVAPIEKEPVVEPQLAQETQKTQESMPARTETPTQLSEEPPSATADVSTAESPEAEPVVQLQEASPVIAPAVVEETVLPMSQPASTQLLDLPTGMSLPPPNGSLLTCPRGPQTHLQTHG